MESYRGAVVAALDLTLNVFKNQALPLLLMGLSGAGVVLVLNSSAWR